MPATAVYLVKSLLMASMAASLMWRGVGKCGSPAPKSTRSTPWALSLPAAATMVSVSDGSMRRRRSLTFFALAGGIVVAIGYRAHDFLADFLPLIFSRN